MKKWMNILFCAVFIASLFLPLFNMNTARNQQSEIDNAYLPELAPLGSGSFIPSVDKYVSKRIGFRGEALYLYQKLNDSLFGMMEHPTYMYGSDGWVYFKDNIYINRFQHLDLDQENANSFAKALSGFQAYAESQDKQFLYWLLPDKETIYPEHYPSAINVIGDVSYVDQILWALEAEGVNYLYAKEAMLKGKEQMLVNNIKYDAGHWNQNGAFVSCVELYERLQQWYPTITPIRQEDYIIETVVQESLDNSRFEINEPVPLYTFNKPVNIVDRSAQIREEIYLPSPNQEVCQYINSDQTDLPSILLLGDSYMVQGLQFFPTNFSQTTFIHRFNCMNQEAFEYYVDLIDPDIVIYENPERTLPIDLYQDFERP